MLKSRILKHSVMVLALCGVMTMLLGCNTLQGVGQDVERVGQKLEQRLD